MTEKISYLPHPVWSLLKGFYVFLMTVYYLHTWTGIHKVLLAEKRYKPLAIRLNNNNHPTSMLRMSKFYIGL